MLTWNLKGKIVDIETAFLHGDLKEIIYVQIPKGLKAEENECLILKKTIHGLIQSAREACFGIKRMRFSRKLRQSLPMDEIFEQRNCFDWNTH